MRPESLFGSFWDGLCQVRRCLRRTSTPVQLHARRRAGRAARPPHSYQNHPGLGRKGCVPGFARFPLDLLFPNNSCLTSQPRKPRRRSPKLSTGSTRQRPTHGRMSPPIASVQDQSCTGKSLGHVFLGGERDPRGLFWDASVHRVVLYSCRACCPTFCSYPDSSFRMLLGE